MHGVRVRQRQPRARVCVCVCVCVSVCVRESQRQRERHTHTYCFSRTCERTHMHTNTNKHTHTHTHKYAHTHTVTARVWCRGAIDRKRNSTINLTTDSGACYWCLPQTSPLTPDVTTIFFSAAGNAKIYLKNYNNIIPRLTLLMETFIHTYNHSFTVLPAKSINTVSLPWKLSDFLDTSFSWTLSFPLGPYFSSFLWGPFNFILLQFVGLHPPSQLGWSQDAPAWACRPSSLQHLCFHPPGSNFWSRSRLLPITHAQLITSCPFNLSVGQSCLHFIFPLISNFSHQYPKSHNLGFHQHPLHDTKIKPSQLALNSSPPYNQTISSSQSKHHVHNW